MSCVVIERVSQSHLDLNVVPNIAKQGSKRHLRRSWLGLKYTTCLLDAVLNLLYPEPCGVLSSD